MREMQWCFVMLYGAFFAASVAATNTPHSIQELDTNLVRFASQISAAYHSVDPLKGVPYPHDALRSLLNQCIWCADRVDRYHESEHWAAYDEEKISSCLNDYTKIVRSYAIRKAVHAPIFSTQQLYQIRDAAGSSEQQYIFHTDLICAIARSVFPVARLRAEIRDTYQRMVACSNEKAYEHEVLDHVRQQLVMVDTRTVQARRQHHGKHQYDACEIVRTGCRELGVPEEYIIPERWHEADITYDDIP